MHLLKIFKILKQKGLVIWGKQHFMETLTFIGAKCASREKVQSESPGSGEHLVPGQCPHCWYSPLVPAEPSLGLLVSICPYQEFTEESEPSSCCGMVDLGWEAAAVSL